MSKGIKNNPAAGRAEQHPCRRLLTAAVTVAGPLLMTMPAFAALNCTTQPSCTELGYSKTNETDCESYVLCPFDTSYKACVKYSTSEADCGGYTLASCPDSAVSCSACGNGTDVKYKVDSCKNGYQLSGNTCVANTCSGYNLTYCPTGATCDECLSGTTTKYKKTGCQGGYVADGDTCYNCSQMRTKLSNAANRTYYLYCDVDGCRTDGGACNSSNSHWFAWNDPCLVSLTGVSKRPPRVDVTTPPLVENPLNPDRDEKVCYQADYNQCIKARDKLEEVLEHHNAICPSYKVTSTNYFFGCNQYPKEEGTSIGNTPEDGIIVNHGGVNIYVCGRLR